MKIDTRVTVNSPARMDHGRKGEVIRVLRDGLFQVYLFPVGSKKPVDWIFHESELTQD